MANKEADEPFRLLKKDGQYEIRWDLNSPNSVSVGFLTEGIISTGDDAYIKLMIVLANSLDNVGLFDNDIKSVIKNSSGLSYSETVTKIERNTNFFSLLYAGTQSRDAVRRDFGMDALREVLEYKGIGWREMQYIGMVKSDDQFPKQAVQVLKGTEVYVAQLFNNRMNIIKFSQEEIKEVIDHMLNHYI